MTKKVGFLFGAGAEIDYGMPSGGKFALNLFRESSDYGKSILRNMREQIDKSSSYASNWLPDSYDQKSITAFGQHIFDTIIRDTIGNNRHNIIVKINSFDELAGSSASRVFKKNSKDALKDLRELVTSDLDKAFDDINISQNLKYNSFFTRGDKLFSNKYFAILLNYYQKFDFPDSNQKKLLGQLITAIMQLQIGALSENLSRNISESVFKKDDLHLDIFDDLGNSLNVNYESAGIEGLKLLSNSELLNDNQHKIINFAYYIIEQIYSDVLNYKTLIDSNWHYLYNPKNEWGKFSKIIVFCILFKITLRSNLRK